MPACTAAAGASRAEQAMAVVLLVAVLGITWGRDFRHQDLRSHATPWGHIVSRIERTCQRDPRGSVVIKHRVRIPCSAVHS